MRTSVCQKSPRKHSPRLQSALGFDEKTPPRKTLKSEGVDLNDPVASGTAGIIDAVLARNQKLAPYIGARIKGLKIAEKGKFVHDTNDVNFDNAYRDAYAPFQSPQQERYACLASMTSVRHEATCVAVRTLERRLLPGVLPPVPYQAESRAPGTM